MNEQKTEPLNFNKTDWQLRETLLKDWLGRRLPIKGIFERATLKESHHNWIALSQETEIQIPNKGWCFLGHMWIQNSDTMKEMLEGDRYQATCQISKYIKTWKGEERRNDPPQIQYNLKYPEDVQLRPITPVSRDGVGYAAGTSVVQVPFATPRLALDTPQGSKGTTIATLAKAKSFAQEMGAERLLQVRDFLRDIGGLDELEEFLTLISQE
jgi:hypothetical protein